MVENDIIFRTRPSIKLIVLGFVGIAAGLFFFSLVMKVPSKSNVDIQTTNNVLMVLKIVFGAMSLYSLFMIMRLRIVYLTDKGLIIRKPLLLFNRVVLYSDIDKIRRDDYKITVQNKDVFRNDNRSIYNGKQMTISLKNGKSIKLNLFETGDYKNLSFKIKDCTDASR